MRRDGLERAVNTDRPTTDDDVSNYKDVHLLTIRNGRLDSRTAADKARNSKKGRNGTI